MDTTIKKKRLVLHFLFSILFCFYFSDGKGQVVLPKDENGKITYLEIIKKDSIPTDTLYKRASNWVNYTYPKSKIIVDTTAKRIATRGRFLVYTKAGVLKEIHGAIRYDLNIEVKENRYRYTFTNFVFEYYKQDRYYKYKPTGKEKPLEDEKFPAWQSAWEKHKYSVDAHVKEKLEDLGKAMDNKKLETMIIQPVKKNEEW